MMQTITRLMVRDHARLLGLFIELKNLKNKDIKKFRELFKKLNNGLRTHFIEEEKIINSAFGKKSDKGSNLLPIASSLKLQHNQITTILESISKSISQGETIDFSDLYLILNKHKNIEERLFYPELDRMLSEKDKLKILETIKRK